MNLENTKIELSELLESDTRVMLNWAKNVYNKVELSEAEKSISKEVGNYVNDIIKFNKTSAKEDIAGLVLKIIEPEVINDSNEVLSTIFTDGEYEEFDKVRVERSPKNTLIARSTAARTGNSKKSYIDYSQGLIREQHLQIDTEIKMSELRKDGALTIATLAIFAIEEFNRSKFRAIIGFVNELITAGGDNYFGSSGVTVAAFDDFVGYLDDNNFSGGYSTVVGLSNRIREASKKVGLENSSEVAKEELFKTAKLNAYGGSLLVPIKAGQKTGEGKQLVPNDVLFGFCGIIGEKYTKGAMNTLVINDNNSEVISIKFTGVEFGICITNPEKIAKLVIS